ncbi:isochorismate synthase [Candidatus Providencia siddallii]|uniref:isochorismate synthase n=1 Tax=Candidatus Providencia siddallii TaxID=1715285 RepID=A0ABM9NNP3_9GAMM
MIDKYNKYFFLKLIDEIILYISMLKLKKNEFISIEKYFNKNLFFLGLKWLSNQIFYPQFYWYNRNGKEENSAIGMLKSFNSINDAEFFLLQHLKYPNLRIWGLNGWNSIGNDISNKVKQKSTFYFLPRLEIFRFNLNITFILNINGKNDILNTINFLQKLRFLSNSKFELSINVISKKYNPNYQEWFNLLTKAIKEIKTGKIKKIVLAREVKINLSSTVSVVKILFFNKKKNYNCYHFMIAFNKNLGFISSTPERLYLRKGKKLFSEALAGTIDNDINKNISKKQSYFLMKNEKSQLENLIVANDICKQLQNIVSSLYVSKPTIIKLCKIQHLCRSINATLIKSLDSICLLRLQPTAAVCGFPRKNSRVFLLRNEPFDRNWYAGTGGFISLNKSEFAVSLRCAQIKKTQIFLYSGAGILDNSDPNEEWKEIEKKIFTLKSLFE